MSIQWNTTHQWKLMDSTYICLRGGINANVDQRKSVMAENSSDSSHSSKPVKPRIELLNNKGMMIRKV